MFLISDTLWQNQFELKGRDAHLTDGFLAMLQWLKCIQTHQIVSCWLTGSHLGALGPKDMELDI